MFEQSIKNFGIHLNSLNERNTVSSGNLVTGHISFDLTKQMKITSITMALLGMAHTHWSSGGGGGRRGRRSRRHFSAKVEFFKFKSVIMQENSAAAGTARLQPGTHMYPFSCQLPQGDFPTAFRGFHGHILYTLTVGINRPWHMSKDFVTELNFVHHIDATQPVLRAPLSGTNEMTVCCLWCAMGPITLTASTEKKAFLPGETAKIICDISNASSRTVTPKVKLRQEQDFYTHNRVSHRRAVKTLASVTGQPISGHTIHVRTELMVAIPESASHTISNCSIIDVHYIIEVSLSVMGATELEVLFPIVICGTPVEALPPQYSDFRSGSPEGCATTHVRA